LSLSVSTNIAELAAHRSLAQTARAMGRSLERLASGFRINRAADDAAGLAVSTGLRAQIGGMTQAVRNTHDGMSVVQTADGALGETVAVLQRMRDLAVQAANEGALDLLAQRAVQAESDQLKAELTRIADTTTFNGRALLDGSYSGVFQVGANPGEAITVTIGRGGRGLDTAGLGLSLIDLTGATSVTTTVTPAVSDEEGTPAPAQLTLAGDFLTPGAYRASFTGLAGTVIYNGATLDLGSVDYSGARTATDYVSRLNASAVAALGTSLISFTGSATGLVFTGETPADGEPPPALGAPPVIGSTAVDAAALTPSYTVERGTLPLIDAALARALSARAELGAVQDGMEHSLARQTVAIENATAAESRIRDTDMAAEMTTFSRNQVLTQAGTAMLAQANQTPQSVLKLLLA
jgi:flagellin-like hook-associated protein FlgL